MKVDIISRETIKPSSPTPPHLRSFKLSLLDQTNIPVYIPFVFFYPNISKRGGGIQTAERSNQLRRSLSETLSRYYPFAGRLKDGFSRIDCNDEGADYVEARVNCELSKFLRKPDMEVLNRFLPCGSFPTEPYHSIVQVAIRVNHFDCGGLAIGMCFLHMIMDGLSMGSFVKDWASIARGSGEAVSPIFLQDSFYPSRDLDLSRLLSNENVESSAAEFVTTTRIERFVFTGSSIAALKANVGSQISSSSTAKPPTRVEVVSSFICQRIMAACRVKPNQKRLPFLARHTIDIRGRLVPPLPRNTIGNMAWEATVSLRNESESELFDLVLQLRDAHRKIDNEHLREFQGDEGVSRFLELMEEDSKERVDFCIFSSLCGMPLYEADFGWGKPAWIYFLGDAVPGINNIVILMDTRDGNGVEAWVTLEEQIMAVLERDKVLLALALPNPSIDGVIFNTSSL